MPRGLSSQAYLESEQDAEEKARLKRQARVIKSWTRLIQGLRIRQRLQEEYADKAQPVNAIRQGEVMKEVCPVVPTITQSHYA